MVAREMTKIHEEFLRGTAGQILDQMRGRDSIRGEITLLIGKSNRPAQPTEPMEKIDGKSDRERTLAHGRHESHRTRTRNFQARGV